MDPDQVFTAPASWRVSAFHERLGRMLLALHRGRPDGMCSCGMDRDACQIVRVSRRLLIDMHEPYRPATRRRGSQGRTR